ncbi:MAG: endolytic transglycosylase MltG [Patescibacteria group bacterium]|nr:endolytic transglycosylase MltG [Patescibacteria group bacterium]
MRIRTYREKIQTAISAYFKSDHPEHVRIISAGAISLFVLFVISYHALFTPPRDFPVGGLVSIEKGMTLDEIAGLLVEKEAIRSPFLFKSFVIASAGDRGSISGDYFFDIPLDAWQVAMRVIRGEFGLDPVRVTIPEGFTVVDIARKLGETLPSFNEEEFIRLAKDEEGYLFPDTYFFLPNIKPTHIIRDMKDNFSQKTLALRSALEASGKTPGEVITMASIIEKEAITSTDKRLVSGILWKRIDIGMPLQVDAPFAYAIGKNTFQLTLDDLAVDSPYNTYKNTGLPVGPIANPGLESILAALEPEKSSYLFYLSDKKSIIHYSATFEEHKRNKSLFLN